MSQSVRSAHPLRPIPPRSPSPGRGRRGGVHLLAEGVLSFLKTAAATGRDALAHAGREEKVALLGLALVLVVLSWP